MTLGRVGQCQYRGYVDSKSRVLMLLLPLSELVFHVRVVRCQVVRGVCVCVCRILTLGSCWRVREDCQRVCERDTRRWADEAGVCRD